MNATIQAPFGRQNTFIVRLLKKFLRTQVGKRLAFTIGLRGFNRVNPVLLKFKRNYAGGLLARGEQLINGMVYAKPMMLGPIFNSRVDVGAKLQATLMSNINNSLSSPTYPLYIALSTASLTPAKGDTTLTSETVVAGIARAIGVAQNFVLPATLDGAGSYDIYKQFTLTGAGTTVVSTALFDAASTGNMFAEVNFGSSAVMATNDILQVTWTVNI